MKNETLLNIVGEFGSPVYVYDATKIEMQYKRLTSAFSKVKQLKINYAVKALSNISVLKLMEKKRSWSRYSFYSRSKIGVGSRF